MSESSNIRVPVFDGEDYDLWSRRVESTLRSKGLWRFCERDPDSPDATATQQEKDKFKRDQAKTLEVIYSGLSDRSMRSVSTEKTPFQILSRLRRRALGDSYFSYARAVRNVNDIRLSENGNMVDHLAALQQAFDKVAMLGDPIADNLKPAILINSLSHEYDGVVQAFLASSGAANPRSAPNYKDLEQKLELEFERHDIVSSSGQDERAFAVKQYGRYNSRHQRRHSSSTDKTLKCYACGALGHRFRDCEHLRHLPGRQKKQQQQACDERSDNVSSPMQSPSVREFGSDDSASGRAYAVHEQSTAVTPLNQWIIDSGASRHMTFVRDDFINFKPLHTHVKVADNGRVRVEGIGALVKETIMDDGSRQLWHLNDVYYMPALGQNLFSVKRQLRETGSN